MKITEDEEEALQIGLKRKAREFVEFGSDLYATK